VHFNYKVESSGPDCDTMFCYFLCAQNSVKSVAKTIELATILVSFTSSTQNYFTPHPMIDSAIEWYTTSLNDSTVLTVLGTIVAIIILISLARAFLKIFIGLLAIGALIIVAMYFLEGEDATEKFLEESAEKIVGEVSGEVAQ
jgi:hypothetical protein